MTRLQYLLLCLMEEAIEVSSKVVILQGDQTLNPDFRKGLVNELNDFIGVVGMITVDGIGTAIRTDIETLNYVKEEMERKFDEEGKNVLRESLLLLNRGVLTLSKGASKSIRFGIFSTHEARTNLSIMLEGYHQVVAAIEMLGKEKFLPENVLKAELMNRKVERVNEFYEISCKMKHAE